MLTSAFVPSCFSKLEGDELAGTHLLLDVVKRIGRVDRETDQDNVGVGVGKRAETVIIFLTSSIPKSEFDVLVIDFDIGDVVLKDSGDVDLRKGSVNEMSVWFISAFKHAGGTMCCG